MREKYEAALGEISDAIEDYCANGNQRYYKRLDQAQDIIMQLIEDHFDNPPLKFEELEVDMWVWDNKYKVYNQIYCLYEDFMSTKHSAIRFKHLNETTQWGDIIEFEANRFYRKQVEE